MAGNKSKPQAKKNGIITELFHIYIVLMTNKNVPKNTCLNLMHFDPCVAHEPTTCFLAA